MIWIGNFTLKLIVGWTFALSPKMIKDKKRKFISFSHKIDKIVVLFKSLVINNNYYNFSFYYEYLLLFQQQGLGRKSHHMTPQLRKMYFFWIPNIAWTTEIHVYINEFQMNIRVLEQRTMWRLFPINHVTLIYLQEKIVSITGCLYVTGLILGLIFWIRQSHSRGRIQINNIRYL